MSKVEELVKLLRSPAPCLGRPYGSLGALCHESADLLTEQAGEIESWAKLAMDLNTYAEHDAECRAYGAFSQDHHDCTCGLSGFVQTLDKMAEALVSPAVLSVKE